MRGVVGERGDLTTRDLRGRSEVEDGKGGGQVTLFGKGRKTRVVLLPAGVWKELSALALPLPDDPLFRSRKKGPAGGPRAITVRQAERLVRQWEDIRRLYLAGASVE